MPRLPPAREVPKSSKRRRGRPRVHREHWSKVNVLLFDRQVSFLQELSLSIRKATGIPINRTQIIRALIDALTRCRLKIATVRSEADLCKALTRRLNAK
jgi:hypothetical protein